MADIEIHQSPISASKGQPSRLTDLIQAYAHASSKSSLKDVDEEEQAQNLINAGLLARDPSTGEYYVSLQETDKFSENVTSVLSGTRIESKAGIEKLHDSGLLSFDPFTGTHYFSLRTEEKPSSKAIAPSDTDRLTAQENVFSREELYQDRVIDPEMTLQSTKALGLSALPGTTVRSEHAISLQPPQASTVASNPYIKGSATSQLLSILRELMTTRRRILEHENEFFYELSQQIIDSAQSRLEAIEQRFQGEIALARATHVSAIVGIVGYSLALTTMIVGVLGTLFDKPKKIADPKKLDIALDPNKQGKLDINIEDPITDDQESKGLLDISLQRTRSRSLASQQHRKDMERSGRLEVELEQEKTAEDKLNKSLGIDLLPYPGTVEAEKLPSSKKSKAPPKETSSEDIARKTRIEAFKGREVKWNVLLDATVMPIFSKAVAQMVIAVKDGMSIAAEREKGMGKAKEALSDAWQKLSFRRLEALENDMQENHEDISSLLSIARRLNQLSGRISSWTFRV